MKKITDKWNAEHVLLVSLVVVSAWMFLEAYEFRDPSGLFPQFTAAICLVGGIIVLMRNYLPTPVRAYIEEEQEMFDVGEISGLSEEKDQSKRQSQSSEISAAVKEPNGGSEIQSKPFSMTGLWENKPFILSVFVLGFTLLSYLIGFLWATPLFVVSYSVYVGHSKHVTMGLIILTFSIVYGFMTALNVALDTGYLHEVIL